MGEVLVGTAFAVALGARTEADHTVVVRTAAVHTGAARIVAVAGPRCSSLSLPAVPKSCCSTRADLCCRERCVREAGIGGMRVACWGPVRVSFSFMRRSEGSTYVFLRHLDAGWWSGLVSA